jgi:prepilin-type processing-associated H-X9-DG protein
MFTESSFAWGAHLLPYLEQSALYDKLQLNQTLEQFLETLAEPQLAQTPLPVFRCPDDQARDTLSSAPLAPNYRDLDRDWLIHRKRLRRRLVSYVASCGYYPPHEPFGPVAGTYFPDFDRKTGPNNGLFYTGSHVSGGDITDGSSHTIAIGERAWFQGSSSWVGTSDVLGPDPGGAGVCLGRSYWRINELPDPPGVFMTSVNGVVIPPFSQFTARDGFSSYHPGGAHFLFADGSVRFLSENIDSRTTTPPHGVDVGPVPDVGLLGLFQLLGIRDDGQSVGAF